MDDELEFMTRSARRRATGVTVGGATRSREIGSTAAQGEDDNNVRQKADVSPVQPPRVFEKVAKATEGNMFVAFEVFITLLLVWNCFEIPFRVAFLPLLQPLPVAFLIVASLIDWLFIADCVLRFFKPYMHRRGYIVRDKVKIRRNYVRSWFVFDLLSSIPWDFMVLIMQQASPRIIENDISWMRFVITTRLLRLPSIFSRLLQWEVTVKQNVNVVLFRASRLLIAMLLWLSAFSCIMNLIADLENLPLSWRTSREIPAQLATELGNPFMYYLNGLYWAIATFTTVCYGDFVATTVGERAFIFFYVFLDVIFFAYICGSIASWLQASEKSRLEMVHQLVTVKKYAAFRGLPPELTQDLLRFVRFEFLAQKKESNDSKFLLEIHPSLRVEAAEHIRDTILMNWTFAMLVDAAFLTGMVVHMRQSHYNSGENIITRGSIGSKMFVLLTGTVKVVGGETFSQKGIIIGERALFEGNTQRMNTVQAVKECEFLCLRHRDLLELLDLYPSNRIICDRYVASHSPFPEVYGSVRLGGDIGDDFAGSMKHI